VVLNLLLLMPPDAPLLLLLLLQVSKPTARSEEVHESVPHPGDHMA
jgi:hypothetical protein